MLRQALRRSITTQRRCRSMSSRSKLDESERIDLSRLLAKRGWRDDLPTRDAISKRFEFGDCAPRRPDARITPRRAPRQAVHLARRRRAFAHAVNEAWGFMSRVALFAEGCDHHPEWLNAAASADNTASRKTPSSAENIASTRVEEGAIDRSTTPSTSRSRRTRRAACRRRTR